MILADKIIDLRKKSGMSQEELADKLGVSRQSVSKWEGAQSIPDLNKILQMADLFNVSTDYLLKDDMELENNKEIPQEKNSSNRIKVSMEEAQEYLSIVDRTRYKTAFGVLLCILSPVTLILLAGLNDAGKISEGLAVGVGLVTLILLVAIAVVLFVTNGFLTKKFEFLETKNIETEYGVTGMVKEKQKDFSNTYRTLTTSGIVVTILAVLPIFVSMIYNKDLYAIFGVCATLVLVSIGVFMIVLVGCKEGSFKKLLEEGDYSRENKKNNASPIMGAYWLIATAIYLLWSFLTNNWRITWVVWVVAGVLCPVVATISNKLTDKK